VGRGGARGEMPLLLVTTVLLIAVVPGDRLPFLRGPAPYPPEWQWEYRNEPTSGHFLPALAAGSALLLLLAASGSRAARRHPRLTATLMLAGASGLGPALQLGLLDLEPGRALPTLFARAVYRTGSSFYTLAVSDEAHDPVEFLRRHADLLPRLQKTAKHAATHPPGPVLYYRALLGLCESSAPVRKLVLAAADMEPVNPHRPRPSHSPAGRAAAVLGGALIAVLCAGVAWPLAWWAHSLGCDPLAAARVGVLWNLVPGPLLVLPMFDQVLALPVAVAAAALAAAVSRGDARPVRWPLVLLAGVAGGVALFFSYGAPAFLAISGLAAIAPALSRRRTSSRSTVTTALLAAAVSAIVFLLPAAFGHHPLVSARTALAIHRDAYTLPRSYPLWLFFNLLDLALFVGVPLALLLALRSVRSGSKVWSGGKYAAGDLLRLAVAAGLALLLFSGQTRGEVGRIWIPLMPAMLMGALMPSDPSREEAFGVGESLAVGAMLLTLALVFRTWWRIP